MLTARAEWTRLGSPRRKRLQGDRVQLQQVSLNLLINAIEAMSGMSEGPRELLISTANPDPEGVLVAVRDRVRVWLPRASSGCSSPSTQPNLAGWEWGCRSAVRSLKLIMDDCGLPRALHAAPLFIRCRHTHYGEERRTLNVSTGLKRICAEAEYGGWERRVLPPGAARLLRAPFRSRPTHVI